jgi:hypothetical protein
MATVLETTTSLGVVSGDFILLTEYSGETNPNVTFDVIFTVTDGLLALQGVTIEIDSVEYLTDTNGQSTIPLIRGGYTADISLSGYLPQSVNFTILDQDVVQNIVLVEIGSFGDSYDDSYEK